MGTGGRDASALRQAKRDGRGSAAWRVKGASRRERQRQRSGVRSKGEPASPSPSCILSSSPRGSSVLHRADGRRLWLGFKAQLSVRLACPESWHGPARAPPALPLAAACVPRPPPPAAAGGPAPPGSAAPTCRAPAARRRQLPPPRAKGASGAGRGGRRRRRDRPWPCGAPPAAVPALCAPGGGSHAARGPSASSPAAAGPGERGGVWRRRGSVVRLRSRPGVSEPSVPRSAGGRASRAPALWKSAGVLRPAGRSLCLPKCFPVAQAGASAPNCQASLQGRRGEGEAGRVVLVCGRKRDRLRHPAAPHEDTMPCRVGEEVGGGFALELPPHLEFPQGKEMYAWFYNPAPALLNFST